MSRHIPAESRGWVFRPGKTAEDFVRVTANGEEIAVTRTDSLAEASFARKPSAILIATICRQFPDAHVTGAYLTPQGEVRLIHV